MGLFEFSRGGRALTLRAVEPHFLAGRVSGTLGFLRNMLSTRKPQSTLKQDFVNIAAKIILGRSQKLRLIVF